jgi:hypothetical protein
MKTREREQARALRRRGRSVKEIARLVGVSPSSVSNWVRDVPLSEEQATALIARMSDCDGRRAATKARVTLWRERRRAYQAEGRARARREDVLHAAGCMLFWAEGSRSRNTVQFTNSDPAMVSFFVRFLREQYRVPDDAFRLACNLFADHAERQHAIEQSWLDATRLPRSSLGKTTVNVYSKHSKKKRLNKLPYGTCRVTVYSTEIVQSIYGSIQEYGGFERPEWLG